jgi:hypothetical protein
VSFERSKLVYRLHCVYGVMLGELIKHIDRAAAMQCGFLISACLSVLKLLCSTWVEPSGTEHVSGKHCSSSCTYHALATLPSPCIPNPGLTHSHVHTRSLVERIYECTDTCKQKQMNSKPWINSQVSFSAWKLGNHFSDSPLAFHFEGFGLCCP